MEHALWIWLDPLSASGTTNRLSIPPGELVTENNLATNSSTIMDSSLMFEAPRNDDAYGYQPYSSGSSVGGSPPYSGSLLQELYDERPHHHHPHHQQQQQHHLQHHHQQHHHVPSYYSDVKLEEHSIEPPLVPSHSHSPPHHHTLLPSPPHHHAHPHQHFLPLPPTPYYAPQPPAYTLSPHTGLPVQHTDDAASKETQYLRRRCFNCHTTEPPSWRRSTLNPGKIVCNKCGLYERTHLRPRPLRFDELRAGNKTRKASGGISKKALPMKGLGLKHSSRSPDSKDWDDSLSLYSGNSSSSSSSYPSPSPYSHTLPLPHSPSASPPPIRLPVAPFQQACSY